MGAREGQTRHMVEGISVLVRVRPATPYEQADEAEVLQIADFGIQRNLVDETILKQRRCAILGVLSYSVFTASHTDLPHISMVGQCVHSLALYIPSYTPSHRWWRSITVAQVCLFGTQSFRTSPSSVTSIVCSVPILPKKMSSSALFLPWTRYSRDSMPASWHTAKRALEKPTRLLVSAFSWYRT